ncbi:aldo/keto reductase family oxidoreductase [Steroidobacter flavus]|uniref:Aldo/keto reductase family oxidoreductase n=1 Tax=Steroidobacter flavus TaxID=1842136 RepID=A0ABV8SZD2_9GAMM
MPTRRTFIMQTASASLLAAANMPAEARPPGSGGSVSVYRLPHTDLEVSRIAFGCAYLLEWNKDPLSSDEVLDASRVINAAYDNGITFFDLADVYGLSKAEQALGAVMKQTSGLRHKIVIQSKCGVGLANDWKFGAPISFFDCSYENIVKSAEGTLDRLGTDYLDILLLHYPDALIQPQEVARAFDDLSRAGKVRYFGVSNHGAAQIELLKKDVVQPLVVNQVNLGLGRPDLIEEAPYGLAGNVRITGIIEYCRQHDISVQAYSPLRGNVMSPPDDAAASIKSAAQYIAQFARSRNTTRWVVALAWLLHHPAKIIPVFGTREPRHVIENCLADAFEMSREDWYRLLMAVMGARIARLE